MRTINKKSFVMESAEDKAVRETAEAAKAAEEGGETGRPASTPVEGEAGAPPAAEPAGDPAPAPDAAPVGDTPPADPAAPAAGDIPPADLGDVPSPEGAGVVPPGEEPQVEESPLEDNAGSVETALIEVADSAAEIESEDTRVDEAMDAVEALEGMRISLESDYQNGGMDKAAAFRFTAQLKYFSKRLGIPVLHGVPSLEKFNGTNSRLPANNIALETLSEFIAKVWEGIQEAISRSIEWFKNFWTKLFSGAETIIERAGKLAAHTPEGEKKGNTFDNESMAQRLHIGGSIPGNAEGAISLQQVTDGLMTKIAQHAAGGEALAKVFEQITAPANLTPAAKAMGAALGGMDGGQLGLDAVSNPAADGLEATPAGVKTYRSKELPGGKAVFARTIEASVFEGDLAVAGEEGGPAAAIAAAGGGVDDFKPNAPDFNGKAIPTLSVEDAKKIAAIVKGIGETLLKARPELEKSSKSKSRIVAASKKIGKLQFDEKDKGTLAVFQRAAGGVTKFIDQPYAAFSMYALHTCKALLDHVEQSFKQYGAAEKATGGAVAAV